MAPNFFLVGTTKGGTSSLDLWLRQHPEVGLPRRKEMHFFCVCPNPRLRVASTWDEYLAAFPAATAVGESSPCYLYYPDIPARLAEFPDSRIIVSLRDPVERFWSHYLMNEVYRPTGKPPLEVVEDNLAAGRTNALEDLVGMGLYGEQIGRYLAEFGRARMAVVFLEETARDPAASLAEICGFLNIAPHVFDTSQREKEYVEPRGPVGRLLLRTSGIRRTGAAVVPSPMRRFLKTRVLGDPSHKPPVPDTVRDRLQDLYRDDSRLLESDLEREVPWGWHRRGR